MGPWSSPCSPSRPRRLAPGRRSPADGAAAGAGSLLKSWRLGPELRVGAGARLADPINAVFADFLCEDEPSLELSIFDGHLAMNGVRVAPCADLALAPLLEGTLLGFAARTRRDCTPLHAGAIEFEGRGLLLLGDKGSGKSTLAASLGRYFTDELAFVEHGTTTLRAFPKAATIKAGSFALFEESRTWSDAVRGPVRYHQPPERADPEAALALSALVFPHYAPGAGRCVELDPVEAAAALIAQLFGGLARHVGAAQTVRALSGLPACALHFGSTEQAAELLRRWR